MKKANGFLEYENVKSVQIVFRTGNSSQIYGRSSMSQSCLIAVYDENVCPIEFAYTFDSDDGELLIIIPDVNYIAKIDGNEIRGDFRLKSVKQVFQGNNNQVIGSFKGGFVVGTIEGNIDI